jgi:hypothetical protein
LASSSHCRAPRALKSRLKRYRQVSRVSEVFKFMRRAKSGTFCGSIQEIKMTNDGLS